MMKSPRNPALRRRLGQAGFTLVEIAMALALIGVLAAITFKSQELVEQYRQSGFVTHVQTLESHLKAYRTAYGRWPGDCNRDGLMDHEFTSVANLPALEKFDYAVPSSLTAASSAADTYALGKTCPGSSLSPWSDVNVPYNELKLGGQSGAGEPNRKVASHGLGGFVYLGTFTQAAQGELAETRFNAMVLTNVTIASARRLAVAIDGSDASASNVNRVRRTEDLSTFAPLWTATGETEAKRITVVIFFDRIPPVPASTS